jgi:hypothetical protein
MDLDVVVECGGFVSWWCRVRHGLTCAHRMMSLTVTQITRSAGTGRRTSDRVRRMSVRRRHHRGRATCAGQGRGHRLVATSSWAVDMGRPPASGAVTSSLPSSLLVRSEDAVLVTASVPRTVDTGQPRWWPARGGRTVSGRYADTVAVDAGCSRRRPAAADGDQQQQRQPHSSSTSSLCFASCSHHQQPSLFASCRCPVLAPLR